MLSCRWTVTRCCGQVEMLCPRQNGALVQPVKGTAIMVFTLPTPARPTASSNARPTALISNEPLTRSAPAASKCKSPTAPSTQGNLRWERSPKAQRSPGNEACEAWLRAAADPAPAYELPEPGPPDIPRLTAAAEQHGVDILGPPPFATDTVPDAQPAAH